LIGADGSWGFGPDWSFHLNQFEALNGTTITMTLSGDVRVESDTAGGIGFDGTLTVNRSRFYLPSLMDATPASDLDRPLLVEAAGVADSVHPVDTTVTSERLPVLNGRLVVSVPRGTWLRGPRVNVELRGELELRMIHGSVDVRGYLAVEQGTYEFYGKKFTIVRGRADFEGGTEIDPTLYLEVEYEFRTDDVENTLLMVVRGSPKTPQIEFFVNKSPVSEADAISYMLFGRKADDLNYGQKSTVSSVGDVLAKDLAANMINSQLSTVLGSALGLDVVRISGEDNWNKATLTAGKYVTDDIYVAYERGMSQSGSSSVAFESATLEYYLWRFLYLRLIEATDKTSGFDLFLKFD
jgi:translocation and assembly module TamB